MPGSSPRPCCRTTSYSELNSFHITNRAASTPGTACVMLFITQSASSGMLRVVVINLPVSCTVTSSLVVFCSLRIRAEARNSITFMADSGLLANSAVISARLIVTASTGILATASAERGCPRNTAISPKNSPRTSTATSLCLPLLRSVTFRTSTSPVRMIYSVSSSEPSSKMVSPGSKDTFLRSCATRPITGVGTS